MEPTITQPDKTIASFIHLSTFSKYFLPFGNFILPLVLWMAKQKNPFVDFHGRQALNFQISIFLYFIFVAGMGIAGIVLLGFEIDFQNSVFVSDNFDHFFRVANAFPMIIFASLIGLLLLGLLILELLSVITATVKASEGLYYRYPLTINFITPTPVGNHQSKDEQFNNTQNQTL